ncbi:MAG TPA: KH domain-containing protein [Candidatus Ozemobacteraceae bacterium]|nr:KH domain-containing protein [Candidatus Ozemobacteraceae bacterium]
MELDSIQQIVLNIVQTLVQYPDQVNIKPIEGESTIVFEVQVHPEDAGKVIGKKGRTINALRTILRASTLLEGKKVMMELV